jgi:hypothetical protein
VVATGVAAFSRLATARSERGDRRGRGARTGRTFGSPRTPSCPPNARVGPRKGASTHALRLPGERPGDARHVAAVPAGCPACLPRSMSTWERCPPSAEAPTPAPSKPGGKLPPAPSSLARRRRVTVRCGAHVAVAVSVDSWNGWGTDGVPVVSPWGPAWARDAAGEQSR